MAPQVGFEPGKTLLRQTTRTHSILVSTRVSGIGFRTARARFGSKRGHFGDSPHEGLWLCPRLTSVHAAWTILGVDRDPEPEAHVLAAAVKAMEPLGLRFKVLNQQGGRDHRPDAILGLRFGGRELRYRVEVKRRLRPATLGAVVHQLRAHGGNPLLVTDHVTPPLAEALRVQGIEFLDAAGNAFLNQPPLLVFVNGQQRCRSAAGSRTRPCLSGDRTPGPIRPARSARACGSSLPRDRRRGRSGARHGGLGHGRASRPRLRRERRRTTPPRQWRTPARPLDRSLCAHPSAQAAPRSIPGRPGCAPEKPRRGRLAC